MRQEKDDLGVVSLNDDMYYGIETARALDNFNVSNEKVNPLIIKELVNIKKQAAIVNYKLTDLSKEKHDYIVAACDLILNGHYNDQFVINKYQGGAGTSTNMNVNEVIANVALECASKPLGTYKFIHPLNDVNKHQSTNDTYPTSIKIAAIKQIRQLAESYASLQTSFQEKETEYGAVIKLGRTQYMDGVPILAGQMFGAYAETVSRDRWRIYKVEERLRMINLGGTAIGTGINAPIRYIFLMTDLLQQSTNIGLSRADNLIDNTQNLDVFSEVSSLLKVAATTLKKIANDLRFLASGPSSGIGEIILKQNQKGSSIMPGKVNPVILEMTILNAEKIIANDMYITNLVASGSNELNPFLPGIAESLLESLTLLKNTVDKLNNKCIKYIKIDKKRCQENVEKSHALITPLIKQIGYDKASEIVKEAIQTNTCVKTILKKQEILSEKELDIYLNPQNLTSPYKD
ncbi:MAG: aspartate ammonia-lyase [Candidatus Izimaplasma sp.]|nr:aspartate ammonia-lyase [Candidatus Izimaplasma bacterium]